MERFRRCPECNSSLDPEEICDCKEVLGIEKERSIDTPPTTNSIITPSTEKCNKNLIGA